MPNNLQLMDQEFQGKRSLGPFLKRIFLHAFKFRIWFWGLIISVAVVAVTDALYPVIWLNYIDNVLTPMIAEYKQGKTMGITPDIEWSGFQRYFWIYMLATAVNVAGVFVFIYFAGHIQEHVMYDLRKAMFDKLQRLSFSYYDRSAIGWLISRITSDTDRVTELISWGFLELVWGITMIFICFLIMFIYNWQLALVVLICMPLLVFVAMRIRLVILKHARQARKLNSELTANFNENINGIEVNKATVQETRVTNNFRDLSEKMRGSSYRAGYYTALYMPVVVMAGSMAAAGVIYFGGNMALASIGGITLGTLAAFFGYARLIFEPIFDITRFYALAQDSLSAGERIFSLIDEKVDIYDRKGATNFDKIKGEIVFENVDFHYVENKPVLNGFNLTIKAGESLALVGPTGEGKTTISSLVGRFYEPKGGRILIDGEDYLSKTVKSLRSQMGIILQTPHIFSGTIKENLRYGSHDAQDKEITHALEMVGAFDLVKRLDQEAGEEGSNLSVGEKQLISLIRAILRNPRILILDEATSSVDTIAEARIQKGIDQLVKGRTSIIIAHRLSTIKGCDRILVIQKGKIIEEGNHESLMERKGAYWTLYASQIRKVA